MADLLPAKVTFQTHSGSTYTINVGEGTIHRSHPSGNSLKDPSGVVVPGNAWLMDHVVGLFTPAGFLQLKADANIGVITPMGAQIPIVGREPIVTTSVKSFEVQG